jgi:hypothetical protein
MLAPKLVQVQWNLSAEAYSARILDITRTSDKTADSFAWLVSQNAEGPKS